MEHLYNLPTLLRLFLFGSLSLILTGLIVIITIMLINKNRKKLFVCYIISMTIYILFISITRTPLISSLDKVLFYILNCVVLAPIVFSIMLLFSTKKKIYLFDSLAFIVNLPFFFILPFWVYVYIVSIGYLFIRALILVVNEYEYSLYNPGTYMIKDALDTLSSGVIFANKNGQITYINSSMKKYLDDLNIRQHNRINKILSQLSELENTDRKISKNDIIISCNDKTLNFKVKKDYSSQSILQVVCNDISEEEKVIKELEETTNQLNMIQKDLQNTLRDINNIQKEKEILRLKGNIHDSMSQRLSILHCYIIENKGEDIMQIKQLITSMLNEMYEVNEINTSSRLDNLISSFALINVKLNIKGKLPKSTEQADFTVKVIRECATNAVKHGQANEINVSIRLNDDKKYHIVIDNNGLPIKNIVEGNGLKIIKYQLSTLNGSMNIVSEPSFYIEFIIYKKGLLRN